MIKPKWLRITIGTMVFFVSLYCTTFVMEYSYPSVNTIALILVCMCSTALSFFGVVGDM